MMPVYFFVGYARRVECDDREEKRSFATANDTPPFHGKAVKGWATRLEGRNFL
jgi:hypothetical protein